jgi:glycogen debranching enzyme
VFWNAKNLYLYDYVDGRHREAAVRPNAIFAVSLPFPLLSPGRSEAVLSVVRERLLTPFGLRSLDPGHPDYRPRYEGDPLARDGAYHQGTVWLWLLGPFIEALVRVKGEAGRNEAREMLERLSVHLRDAGIGTLSEIFDGEAPHEPRGCIAQAWSVGEVLRAWMDLDRRKGG